MMLMSDVASMAEGIPMYVFTTDQFDHHLLEGKVVIVISRSLEPGPAWPYGRPHSGLHCAQQHRPTSPSRSREERLESLRCSVPVSV